MEVLKEYHESIFLDPIFACGRASLAISCTNFEEMRLIDAFMKKIFESVDF